MKTPTTTPPLIVLKGLEGNQPTHLYGLQVYLAPHLAMLTALWWIVFVVTLATVVARTISRK
jgi:cytochrome c-type biogenesis protein CcmH/NrfF